jgi:2-polyprenyl-3-methyl-5-hydroxy-6-metoxy-1,4-benzoquinol methylase
MKRQEAAPHDVTAHNGNGLEHDIQGAIARQAASRRGAILRPVDLVERQGSGKTRHPWELARAEFFLRLLDTYDLLAADCNWLDAGAGDGWFAGQLRRLLPPRANITCWDINYTDEDVETLAAESGDGVAFVRAQPTDRFDRVLSLDVMEHIDDDLGFLRAIVDDLLAEDGVVVVSVPAYASLFSSHDRAMRHRRRYSPAGCRSLLERAGLAVVSSGGLFASLVPVRAGQVLFEHVRPKRVSSSGVGDWQHGAFVTGAMTRMLAIDGRVSLALSRHGRSAPGLSYWALCRPSRA